MKLASKVSIIMATYNRVHFIVETIKSIQAQTYTNWECLIVDDGSTDDTETVLKPILKQDQRFIYCKRPETHKKGLPGSRNYGLNIAKGEFVIFFDDDDVVHPLCLEFSLSALKSVSGAAFCNFKKLAFSGDFDYKLMKLNSGFIPQKTRNNLLESVVTQKIPFASCTVLWNKKCFQEHAFNENLMYAEEWECYQRILSKNGNGVLIDNVLYYNRKHDNSNTGEFWRNAKVRVDSKKEAINLVVSNLYKNGLLTPYLFKYLINLAISFRDYKLVRKILKNTGSKIKLWLFYSIKYVAFPFWVRYKKQYKK